MVSFSAKDLKVSLKHLDWTYQDLADNSGVSVRTIERWATSIGNLTGHQSRLDAVAACFKAQGLEIGELSGVLSVVQLDIAKLRVSKAPELKPLVDLIQVWSDAIHNHRATYNAMESAGHTFNVVDLVGGDMIYKRIGTGFFWSGGSRWIGSKILDLPDAQASKAATERHWSALIHNSPVATYFNRSQGLSYMAVTVPTWRKTSDKCESFISAGYMGRVRL